MRAISVKQPWAWLLFHGKSVENRDWYTGYRGPLAIHASRSMTRCEYTEAVDFVFHFDPELAARIPAMNDLPRGAVIGTVEQVGCVRKHPSPFFQGRFGHVYERAAELEKPVPAKGALGFWEWEPPAPAPPEGAES